GTTVTNNLVLTINGTKFDSTTLGINNADLVFVPTANANGAVTPNITFQVIDSGSTVNAGDVNTDQSPNTLTLSLSAINDAPTAQSASQSVLFNTQYSFKTADFAFADTTDNPSP